MLNISRLNGRIREFIGDIAGADYVLNGLPEIIIFS